MDSDDRTSVTDFGLRPRLVVEPLIAALIAEAALELWPHPPAVDPAAEAARAVRAEQAERAWRLSGRWWNRRMTRRTNRPWAR